MARRTSGEGRRSGGAADDVDAFMARLEHPLKPEIEALRQIIGGADPRIAESVKWNAPSYAIDDHFATLRLHPPTSVQITLHTGAKLRPNRPAMQIDDPEGLLKWAAKDRCSAAFHSLDEIAARQAALLAILRQWIAQL